MTTITIDAARALDLLEQAVAQRGREFRYGDRYNIDMCAYQRDGKPACLIGLALHLAGADLDWLDSAMPVGAGWVDSTAGHPEVNSETLREAATYAMVAVYHHGHGEGPFAGDPPPFRLTEEAARIFWAAQQAQDRNETWGTALDFARAVAGDLAEQLVSA